MGKSCISNNIRKLRFFHDEMTQQQLAEKVGSHAANHHRDGTGQILPVARIGFSHCTGL